MHMHLLPVGSTRSSAGVPGIYTASPTPLPHVLERQTCLAAARAWRTTKQWTRQHANQAEEPSEAYVSKFLATTYKECVCTR